MELKRINGKMAWGIFMVWIYLSMAFLLIFSNLFEDNMSFTMRMVCGAFFAGYAAFRIYRLIKVGK